MPLIKDSTSTSSSASTPASTPAPTQPAFHFTPLGGRVGRCRRHKPVVTKPAHVKPAAPTAAVIWTNGKRQVVGLAQTFNVGDVQFRLAAVTRKPMRIKAVGGPFAGGKHAITVRKGHGVKLANTATGISTASASRRDHGRSDRDPAVEHDPRAAASARRTRAHESIPEKGEQRRDEQQRSSRRQGRAPPSAASPTSDLLRRYSPCFAADPRRRRRGAAARPSATPTGLQNFSLKLNDAPDDSRDRHPDLLADAVLRVGAGPRRDALRVRALDQQELRLRQQPHLVEQDAHDSGGGRSDLAAVDHRRPQRRCTGTCARTARRRVSRPGARRAASTCAGRTSRQGQRRRRVGVPQRLTSEPGYIRWTPIEGATGYDVWFLNLGVDATSASARSSRRSRRSPTSASTTRCALRRSHVEWRVRAQARALRQDAERPAARLVRPVEQPSEYTSTAGAISADVATSHARSRRSRPRSCPTAGSVRAHALMPAFVFSSDGRPLHRVYIATDRDCVNIVHVGSIVGGTAYAPRVTGPLALNPETWNDRTRTRSSSTGRKARLSGRTARP